MIFSFSPDPASFSPSSVGLYRKGFRRDEEIIHRYYVYTGKEKASRERRIIIMSYNVLFTLSTIFHLNIPIEKVNF